MPKRLACLLASKVATSKYFFVVLCLRSHKFNLVLPQRCLIVKKVPKKAVSLMASKVATAQPFFCSMLEMAQIQFNDSVVFDS